MSTKKEEQEKKVKIVVVSRFRDKLDHKTLHEVGEELEFDEVRATDVIARKLAELVVKEG
jgi:hypothetical protein